MDPKGSLQYSHKPVTGSYFEPDESKPHILFSFFKIHFNIIMTSKPRFSMRILSLRFSDDIFCDSSILQMAAAASSEMLVPIFQTI
jgi:hypothetical protein